MKSIERLMARAMTNPQAAATHIPADADPAALADLYCRLSTHAGADSQGHALAIELHLRTLATVRFDEPGVLGALARIERHRDALPARLRA